MKTPANLTEPPTSGPNRSNVISSPWRFIRGAEHISVIRADTDDIVTYGAQFFIDPAPVEQLDDLSKFEKVVPGDLLRVRVALTRVQNVCHTVLTLSVVDSQSGPLPSGVRTARFSGPNVPMIGCVASEGRDPSGEPAVIWDFQIGNSQAATALTTRRGSAYCRSRTGWEHAPLDPRRVESGLDALSRELLACALFDAGVVASVTTHQVVSGSTETADSYSFVDVKSRPGPNKGRTNVQYFEGTRSDGSEEVTREDE